MRRERSSKSGIRWGSTMGTFAAVFMLFLIFIVSVGLFRSEPEEEVSVVDSIADILKPDPISQAVIDGAIDTESPQATLRWNSTNEIVGEARRGEKDDQYYLEITATLPEIDREVHYYQVWLLSRLPYTFFSVGEMVTDEDGKFIFEWEAPDDEDYASYTEVIITVNQYEGSADPDQQRALGVFGD